MKLDLLTNAIVIHDPMRFVSQQSKKNTKSSDDDNEHVKESEEPDYNEDKSD
jgi:hypothetical protein